MPKMTYFVRAKMRVLVCVFNEGHMRTAPHYKQDKCFMHHATAAPFEVVSCISKLREYVRYHGKCIVQSTC